MKVLLIDPCGCMVDLAIKSSLAGHDVKLWIKKGIDGSRSSVGDGLVNRIAEWQPFMRWADIVILADNAYHMSFMEKYHAQGFPIFGSNSNGADLELHRGYGQKVMESAGLSVLPSMQFKTYNEAIEYVKANPKRYVSKPSGDVDKALTYVSKGAADMVFMLERWRSKGKNKMPFILQEFEAGIEMAVGGWMGAGGFSQWKCENFEHKKHMSGDYSIATGEMGTCLKYVKQSNLFDETLARFEDYLCLSGYRGYVDLAFIINDAGEPKPLEFTTRPGWPLMNIQTFMHQGDPIQWMADSLEGKDTLEVSKDIATGVVVAIPDFPYTKHTGRDASGFPIYGLDECGEALRLCEVKQGRAPQDRDGKIVTEDCIVTAGDYVGVACGEGSTVKRACKNAYDVVKMVNIPNSLVVRDDIGERLEKQLPILQKQGFAKSWSYS